MKIACPCGYIIEVQLSRIKRKKYCSKKCLYLYRKRPNSLTYIIKNNNPTWFKKGQISWHKGMRRPFRGKTYDGLHDWVERNFGKPKLCDFCGTTDSKHFEWSNVSGEYKPIESDWQRLCKKCHCRYDFNNFGARKEFYR